MIRRISGLLLFLLLFLPYFIIAQNTYSRVRVFIEREELQKLASIGIDITEGNYRPNVYLETDLNSTQLSQLDQQDISYEIQIEDVGRFYAKRATASSQNMPHERDNVYPVPVHFELGSMAGYYTLEEALNELDEMVSLYPDLITTKTPISTDTITHDGNMLYWVKISDNASQNEDEPELLYTALHHAREPISLQSLIYYMWYLLENYNSLPDVAWLVDNTEMYFVPVVNPDGYEYNRVSYPAGGGMWRKNRNNNGDGTFGVDINRNYSYMWGYDNSGSSPNTNEETYRGVSPMSEPETRNIRQFCAENEFQIALNYHSYGNLLIYPWGYTTEVSPDNELMTDFARLMTARNNYLYGPGGPTLYPTNGDSNDWMYGDENYKGKIFSYVPEIGDSGDGFWPETSRIIPLCQENVYQSLMAAQLLLHYAEVTSTSPISVPQLAGKAHFDFKRLGLKNGGTYTVSISPLDNNIQWVGDPITYSNPDLLAIQSDFIAFGLNADIEVGTSFYYLLSVENGQQTFSDTIMRVFGEEFDIFVSDMETELWKSMKWDETMASYYSPVKSMTDSPFGNYSNNENSQVILDSVIDLSGAKAAFLRFWAKWEIEADYDYVQVFASTDTAVGWTPLMGKYTNEGTVNQAEGQPVYDGFQYTWVEEEINLNVFLGQQIMIRFVLISDQYHREDGFYFDDMTVTIISPPTGNIVDYQTSNTGMLTVYPNPAKEILYIKYISVQSKNVRMVVYDALARPVIARDLLNKNGYLELSVSSLKPGFYFVALQAGEHQLAIKKIMIE